MGANMTSICSTSSRSTISISARWRTRASTSSTRATSWPTRTLRPTIDFDNIAGVVAHEYFHNWSGDRVTCRDWFQLSLKEGFTVFRDQSFSADMGSGGGQADRGCPPAARRAVPGGRRAAGASGPAGKLYRNHQLLHGDGLQQGRRADPHDADDPGPEKRSARAAISISSGTTARPRPARISSRRWRMRAGSTSRQFRLWYSQAGTPQVKARLDHDPASATATLHLSQTIPDTPGQPGKQPMVHPAARLR